MKAATRTRVLILAGVILLLAATVWLFSGASRAAEEWKRSFPVSIVEVVTSNRSYPNRDGICCDYIELHNSSDTPVDLSGYGLTDSDRTVKYFFPPETVLAPGAYLPVYCYTGLEGPFYAALELRRAGGETIRLVNPLGEVVQEVMTLPLEADSSMILEDGEWTAVDYVTPGYENTPEGNALWHAASGSFNAPVRFSEVLASNSLYPNGDDVCCDFIELANVSGADVALLDYTLTDTSGRELYRFPDVTVPADGYVVIYCCDDAVGEDYAGFGVSKDGGETFLLRDATGLVLDSLLTVACGKNESYADIDGEWTLVEYATPGFANGEEGRNLYAASQGFSVCPVKITELMAKNSATLAGADGSFPDWIELTNLGDEPFDLEGFWLSDGVDPLSWQLPEIVLAPGEQTVIYCAAGGADFSLASGGGTVTLSDPTGVLRDSVTYPALSDDEAWALEIYSGTWNAVKNATPGFPNTAEGVIACRASRIPSGLRISEVMSFNDSYLPVAKLYYDWVELYNAGDAEISLSDYFLTDSADEPELFQLPEVTLAPGGYYCAVLTDDAGLSLSPDGDSLLLFDSAGRPVDYAALPAIPRGRSYGRDADGVFAFFDTPTPKAANGAPLVAVAMEPKPSVPGGIYNNVDKLTVELIGSGTIYYTTDGSIPTERSEVYTAPLELTKTTAIRAVAVDDGRLPSGVMTVSYIINENHTLPVVSLVSAPDGMFSASSGIYVAGNNMNYYQNWERAGSVELFEQGGGGFSIDCGITMFGAGSRQCCSKKSLKLLFKGRYEGPLHYDVFRDGEVTEFESLILRGGEDYRFSIVRDEFACRLAKEGCPDVMVQNMRYSILYINGRYFGIFAIREQYSPEYYAAHMNVSPESVTVQPGPVWSGELRQLMDRIYSMRMDDATVEELSKVLHFGSMIDWTILQAYSKNTDIPGNVRYIRSTEDGNQWHWCYYDQDWSYHSYAGFDIVLEPDRQHGVLPRSLLKNKAFQERFCRRVKELCDTVLTTQHVSDVLEELVREVEPEVDRDLKRWYLTRGSWEFYLNRMRTYITIRDRATDLKWSAANYLHLSAKERAEWLGLE